MIREEVGSLYDRLEANSLGDMKRDIAGIKGRLDSLDERVDSMAEDVAKIPVIEGEIRQINQRLERLEGHAGI